MRNIFFTSDFHCGHLRILEYTERPWYSVPEMNEALIEIFNERVSPGDITYFLGDVAMGKIADSLPLIDRLNGEKVLIWGNHDRVFPKPKKRWLEEYGKYFSEMCAEMWLPIQGIPVLMCHFPYYGDSGEEDRFESFRPTDSGMWLLHGHTHTAEFVHDENMIHVGVDSAEASYGPIPIETIEGVIS